MRYCTYSSIFLVYFRMKITIFTLTACCIAVCLAEPKPDVKDAKNTSDKTKGRFLSLPVPAKCASRKFIDPIFKLYTDRNECIKFCLLQAGFKEGQCVWSLKKEVIRKAPMILSNSFFFGLPAKNWWKFNGESLTCYGLVLWVLDSFFNHSQL